MGSSGEEPEWLSLFRARAAPEEVATAWVRGFSEAERLEAQGDAPAARAQLRRLITDSQCPEVRADAADGWKYTGSILRAADAALGIPPPVPRTLGGPGGGGSAGAGPGVPAASGSGAPARSREVIHGEGKPGTLGLCWSDFGGACNTEELRSHGVTRRLNVAAEAVGRLPQDDGIPITDVPMEDIFDDERASQAVSTWVVQLREVLALLRSWREEGAVVNINCQMGKNRSGCSVLVWLCAECGWKVEAAVEHLRGVTALGLANPHLVRAACMALGSDAEVPLNPAGDGGGWVCISPPGTPRVGGTKSFEDMQRAAIERLQGSDGAAGTAGGPSGEEKEDDDDDVAPIFGELSDVD